MPNKVQRKKESTKEKKANTLEEAGITPGNKRSQEEIKSMMDEVEKRIDAFMKEVGYKDPAEQTDDDGWRHISFGSAIGRAGALELNNNVYLRIESPIMDLPSEKELILPLYRELLEINFFMLGVIKLCVKEERVFLTGIYPFQLLSEEEVGKCIDSMMKISNEIDDSLRNKYAGTTIKRDNKSGKE